MSDQDIEWVETALQGRQLALNELRYMGLLPVPPSPPEPILERQVERPKSWLASRALPVVAVVVLGGAALALVGALGYVWMLLARGLVQW